MELEIRPLTQDDEPEWDRYVRHHPDGTIYHLNAWKMAVEKTFAYKNSNFIARQNGRTCGVVPLFIVPTLFSGKKAVSMPFAMYGGMLGDTAAIQKQLVDFTVDHAQRQKSHCLELRYDRDHGYDFPRSDLYVTYRKELPADDEAILEGIPRKSRASIRSGLQKYNLSTRPETDLRTLYRLYALNKRDLGSPAYPRIFFEHLVRGFGPAAGIHTTYYQDRPVASVLYFLFRDAIFPYFSGGDKRYYFTNASAVLYYELMKYARQQGCRIFDFGRSRKNTGAGTFKEHLGFAPAPLHYYFWHPGHRSVPNISPSNPKFNLATVLWKKLPIPVATYLGSKIVKYIP